MAEKKTPMRKCIGCNEMKDKRELIRIVRNSEGVMNVDPSGKLSGRGAYICKCTDCFDAAVKAKRLERAFKTRIPDEIYTSLREALSENC
ncbi:MAG: YlxR family protein [Ruminococcaceae bacterium]|nr:YlxR family protein [Oscillospiraceae bacterium]